MFDPRIERDSERTDMRRLTNHRFNDNATIDALIDVVHALCCASPDEIRILSGLVRAMRHERGRMAADITGTAAESRDRAIANAMGAADKHIEDAAPWLRRAAWHIALALDAIGKEG